MRKRKARPGDDAAEDEGDGDFVIKSVDRQTQRTLKQLEAVAHEHVSANAAAAVAGAAATARRDVSPTGFDQEAPVTAPACQSPTTPGFDCQRARGGCTDAGPPASAAAGRSPAGATPLRPERQQQPLPMHLSEELEGAEALQGLGAGGEQLVVKAEVQAGASAVGGTAEEEGKAVGVAAAATAGAGAQEASTPGAARHMPVAEPPQPWPPSPAPQSRPAAEPAGAAAAPATHGGRAACSGLGPSIAAPAVTIAAAAAAVPYEADLLFTWVQCEAEGCGKWRRVRRSEVPDGPFHCADNGLPGYAECSTPQELPDEEIDRLLEDEAGLRFSSSSARPPLCSCPEGAFESDLAAFLSSRGEENLATYVREKRITCNNSPLDLYSLYREVIACGGFEANERYDERGRWTGGINFAGDVFPMMSNFTPNNRATSVGNQLLNNYKKFLLAYERAWRHADMPRAGAAPAGGAARRRRAAAAALQQRGGSAGGGARGERCGDRATCSGSPPLADDPLAFLANIAHGAEAATAGGAQAHSPQQQGYDDQPTSSSHPPQEQQQQTPWEASLQQEARRQRLLQRQQTADLSWQPPRPAKRSSSPTALDSSGGNDGAASRHQLCSHHRLAAAGGAVDSRHKGCCSSGGGEGPCTSGGAAAAAATCVRAVAARARQQGLARALQGGSMQHPPGGLLLVQDASVAGVVWPVVAAGVEDLPLCVAAGGCMDGGRTLVDVPLVQQEDLPGSSAIPVLLVSTSQLGWVDARTCQPFSQRAADAAHAAAWAALGGCCGGGLPPLGQQRQGPHRQQQSLLACVRGLKLASQWAATAAASSQPCCSAPAASAAPPAPRAWLQAVASAASAQKLLELEGRLPPEALRNGSHCFWSGWRAAVAAAASPAALSAQALMLAQQLDLGVLQRGAGGTMWEELQQLLGVPLPPPSGGGCDGGMHGTGRWRRGEEEAPSCLGVDEGVELLCEAVDWRRVQKMWLGACQAGGAANSPTRLMEEVPRKQRTARPKQPRGRQPAASFLGLGDCGDDEEGGEALACATLAAAADDAAGGAGEGRSVQQAEGEVEEAAAGHEQASLGHDQPPLPVALRQQSPEPGEAA